MDVKANWRSVRDARDRAVQSLLLAFDSLTLGNDQAVFDAYVADVITDVQQMQTQGHILCLVRDEQKRKRKKCNT